MYATTYIRVVRACSRSTRDQGISEHSSLIPHTTPVTALAPLLAPPIRSFKSGFSLIFSKKSCKKSRSSLISVVR